MQRNGIAIASIAIALASTIGHHTGQVTTTQDCLQQSLVSSLKVDVFLMLLNAMLLVMTGVYCGGFDWDAFVGWDWDNVFTGMICFSMPMIEIDEHVINSANIFCIISAFRDNA